MTWKFWKSWFNSGGDENPHAADAPETLDTSAAADDHPAASVAEPTQSIIYISETLLERTRRILASFADKRRSEGICYWFGLDAEDFSVVTTLVVPDADTRWGCIQTTPKVNAQALSVIIGTPLVLIGQAHSHPGTMVTHSETDDKETFASFDGALSLVVPNFAQDEIINLDDCGLHRHRGGRFELIESSEIEQHLCVLPGEADFRIKRKSKRH